MTGSMCKGQQHENCGVRLRQPSGKVFRCDCDCHKPPQIASNEDFEWSEEDEHKFNSPQQP